MNLVEPTADDIEMWAKVDGVAGRKVLIGGPEEGDGVIPCPAIVTGGVIHVAYQLNEIEVAALAHGKLLWLTTWGPLPVHMIEVEEHVGRIGGA
jgi:hypothetical protein